MHTKTNKVSTSRTGIFSKLKDEKLAFSESNFQETRESGGGGLSVCRFSMAFMSHHCGRYSVSEVPFKFEIQAY